MLKFFVVSTRRADGPTFEVVSFDPNTKLGVLKGRHGGLFKEPIDAETLKNLGYKLEKREVPDAIQ